MTKQELQIKGMHCTSCALNIENKLKKVEGLKNVSVNFANEKAYFEGSVSKATKIINELGYNVTSVKSDDELLLARNKFLISLIFGIPLFIISMGPMLGLIPMIENNFLIELALATPIIIVSYKFYIQGIKVAFKNKSANMDTLIAIGTGTAYVYSILNGLLGGTIYFESAGVLLMFILMGKYLEARTKHSTGNAIRELMNLAPDKAVIVRKGKELTVNINEVIPGDILLVKPGQRVPVDGAITSGTSSVDESMITGESMPVLKKKDDEVIGGTINGRGVFYYKALRVGADTYLARIVKLVDNAQGSKAPIQKLADKVSGIFVPIVLLIALSSITTWLLLGSKLSFSLMTMISVLVIACPCALGLATPTAVIVGSGMGAKNGVLFKTSEKLEILSKVKIFVFDKTGTLTKGSPVVTHLSGDEKTIFYAASAERFSEHPLAKAIIDRAKNMKLSKPKNFKNYPGMGVKCTINGNNVLVGSEELMIKNKLKIPNEIITIANKAKTIVLVSVNKKIIGFLGINDPIKEGSKEAISELKNRGGSVYMITGDNEITARAVANEVGITNVISKVKPEDKAKKVSELKKQGLTAFIGDGVNDAPALAVSDVGIAIGSGTDVAIETGDVILVKGDLRKVLSAVKLSSHTINKVKQNLFWAFFYNVIAIPAAFMGLLNPVIAGSAMAMSSVSVVTNSLLLKFKNI